MTAAETYTAQIDDYNAQRARIYGDRLPPDTLRSDLNSVQLCALVRGSCAAHTIRA